MTANAKVLYVLIDATNTAVLEGEKGMLELFSVGLHDCRVVPKVTLTFTE